MLTTRNAGRSGGNPDPDFHDRWFDIMKGVIQWFIENTVAANLLMIFFIAGGLLALTTLHSEDFPSVDTGVNTN